MTLLEALRELREKGPADRQAGMCTNLDDMGISTPMYYMVMSKLFSRWPNFSGSILYPVPAGNGSTSVRGARRSYFFGWRDMWDRNHPYGALRWELLDFMITELEKELEQ